MTADGCSPDVVGYRPEDIYYRDPEVSGNPTIGWRVIFTPGQPGALASIKRSLLQERPHKVPADFRAYSNAQLRRRTIQDKRSWARSAIPNTASMGKFNADRSINDYVENLETGFKGASSTSPGFYQPASQRIEAPIRAIAGRFPDPARSIPGVDRVGGRVSLFAFGRLLSRPGG